MITAPLISDELENARNLERVGRQTEAYDIYQGWLNTPLNRKDQRFGRILLHLIRMPGTAEDDLNLLKAHLTFVPSGEDRNTLLQYAIVLSELIGADSNGFRKQLGSEIPSDEGLFGRLPPEADEAYPDPSLNSSAQGKDDFLRYLAYNSWSGDMLHIWVGKVKTLRPELWDSSDWLYQLLRVMERGGQNAETEEIRSRILTKFSDSLEADLLRGSVSLLPSPADLLADGTLLPPGTDNRETAKPETSDTVAGFPSFFQVGAFSKHENATNLMERLRKEGLESSIVENGGVYKLIVISHNDLQTTEVLKALDLKGFRIPRIP